MSHPTASRVNRDDIRLELGITHWSPKQEKQVIRLRNIRTSQALCLGLDVVCDDTNISNRTLGDLRSIANNCGAEFEVNDSFMQVPIEECFKRDLQREHPVGKDVIERMYYQWWEQYWRANKNPNDNNNGPEAIICDLDGTLAIFPDGANPYERDFTQDEVNRPVLCTISQMRGGRWRIIFMSGREEKAREQTEQWLAKYAITPEWHFEYQLFMRQTGDRRKDTIVKRELYDQHVSGKYRVLYVLDDRPSVVRMWRGELGLTCFQVSNNVEF